MLRIFKHLLKLQSRHLLFVDLPSRMMRSIKPIKMRELLVFTHQIARLLKAGIPLLSILQLLKSTTKNTSLTHYIQKLIVNLEEGFSLSEALEGNKLYFNQFYCSLIALGERTATLGLMFDRIAVYQEKNMKLRSKITNALVYPLVVLSVAILVFIALLMGVVPQFEQFFSEVGAQLPFITRIIIYLSKNIGYISFTFGFLVSMIVIIFVF